jgi:hypothetical protein
MNLTQTPAADLAELTVTEAETLAVILGSAIHHMSTVTNRDGSYPWYHADLNIAVTEMCDGFYHVVNSALAAGATADLYQSFL